MIYPLSYVQMPKMSSKQLITRTQDASMPLLVGSPRAIGQFSVLEGATDLVTAIQLEATEGGPFILSFELRGNWSGQSLSDGTALWSVSGSSGVPLQRRFFEGNFTKTAGGDVGYGGTRLGVELTDLSAASELRISVSGEAEIVRGPWKVDFRD